MEDPKRHCAVRFSTFLEALDFFFPSSFFGAFGRSRFDGCVGVWEFEGVLLEFCSLDVLAAVVGIRGRSEPLCLSRPWLSFDLNLVLADLTASSGRVSLPIWF